MNYFFGISNNFLSSQLTVPLFKNSREKSDLELYKVYPYEKKWRYEIIKIKKIDDLFFIISEENINSKFAFFLAKPNELKKNNNNKLYNINSFTETSPAYRANLRVYLKDGGFSSYQSEYPFEMVSKKGMIVSSVNSLANIDANENYLIFRNIYEEPAHNEFNGYFIDYKNKKIIEHVNLFTNTTSIIKINKNLIKPEIYFVSKNYLGIPIYLSIKNKFLSIEHTNPPHSFILSNNKFEIISKIKEEINEIIN